MGVSVRVLDRIHIDVAGKPIGLPASGRAMALLGWLAIHPGRHSRAEIASSLWPDVSDCSARNSVRTALWHLRQSLDTHADLILETSRDYIGLRDVSVDYRRFGELVDAGNIDEALAVGRGKLLACLDDEWAMLARDAHRDRLIALLIDCSDAASADGNHSVAIARAQAASELNPLSESCARVLMRRHDESGDRSVALRVYGRLVERLRRELKIAVSEETWRLAESIRTRQVDRPAETTAHICLPVQLTSFVGRGTAISEVREILADHRLVTLTGAGGVGKTRLAVQIAALSLRERMERVWFVDLAPIAEPTLVPATVTRALGLADQPGSSPLETLVRFMGDRQVLVVVDNCEHLLDSSARLIVAMLSACPGLTVLATSREPIGVPGEVIWRVPSLSLADEALDLFTDRVRDNQPGYILTETDVPVVTDICARLDGVPLAIELAAARVRTLSLVEIAEGLKDCFQLLTRDARTVVPRHQALRASVDWSYALLPECQRRLLRRLAVFSGGFDLAAACAVAANGAQRFEVLDQLTALVDKSFAVVECRQGASRYRLLETMRQYASEKLGECAEADVVYELHRGFYIELAAQLNRPPDNGYEQLVDKAVIELDNLRAAFVRSCNQSDMTCAMQLVSSLQPLWAERGRLLEGSTWFEAVLNGASGNGDKVSPAIRARALADRASLDAMRRQDSLLQAEQAVTIARELNDPVLLGHALVACCAIAADKPEIAETYFAEAVELARNLNDRRMLSQIHGWQSYSAMVAGDPIAARAVGESGRDLADTIGDGFNSRRCRVALGWAQTIQGELGLAASQFTAVRAEAEADQDVIGMVLALMGLGYALAFQGNITEASTAAGAAAQVAAEVGGLVESAACAAVAVAAFAAGDVTAAWRASEVIVRHARMQGAINTERMAQASLADGELLAARRWADDAVNTTMGWHRVLALTTRARVNRAMGEAGQANRDLRDALAGASEIEARTGVADIFECLADLRYDAGLPIEATSFYGTADALRRRTGEVRFQIYDADHNAAIGTLRRALGEDDFASAWALGVAFGPPHIVSNQPCVD